MHMIPLLTILLAAAAPARAAAEGACTQLLQDGGFEGGTGSSAWTQSGTHAGSPVCNPLSCGTGGGTAGPRSGSWWTWFGGYPTLEQSSVRQAFTPPAGGSSRLRFHLWIGARSGNGTDVFRATVDGQTVFEVAESDPGFGAYTAVDVDVTQLAPPGTHAVRLEATTLGPGVTNFNADDVSVEWCPFPTVSIGDAAAVPEGDTGTTPVVFPVALSEPAAHTVFVGWAAVPTTSGHPATPGTDYTAASGTLTFPAGAVARTVTVGALGDAVDEFDETFAVVLTGPSGTVVADGQAVATIADDDAVPVVSVGDAVAAEGGTAALALSMAPASGRPVVVSFTTSDGTAAAGTDYEAASGSVTLAPGAQRGSFVVATRPDPLDEVDEVFHADVTADFASAGDAQADVTIDDDDGPAVRIADGGVLEPDVDRVPAFFEVTLDAPSPQQVTAVFASEDGTALADIDYEPAAGSVTFAPGQTSALVRVDVRGDVQDEPVETFVVRLESAVDGRPEGPPATGFIQDQDGGTLPWKGDLGHGVQRTDHLASAPGPSRHLYLLTRPPATSWEVVVDAASGDLGAGAGPAVARLATDLSTVLQTSSPLGLGPARRLAVADDTGHAAADYVEIRSAGCASDCGTDDTYRVTARETTLSAPRFSNTGGQVSVVLLQDRAGDGVRGTVWFWSAAGTALGSRPFDLAPFETLALDTASVAGVAGQSGAVTVSHDGGYAALAGKVVGVDPAAGFTFDTPLEPRRR